jgi:hypothetical protein
LDAFFVCTLPSPSYKLSSACCCWMCCCLPSGPWLPRQPECCGCVHLLQEAPRVPEPCQGRPSGHQRHRYEVSKEVTKMLLVLPGIRWCCVAST